MSAALQLVSTDKLTMYRDKAHQELDKFIDRLAPKLLQEDPLTLREISDAFQENRSELLGGLLRDFLGVHHLESLEQELCECPQCKKRLRKKRDASRKIETRQGASLLDRPYFYCADCGIGFSPVDNSLELASRKKQYDLQQQALELLADVPFERAAELFEKLTGIPFSDSRMHGLFETFSDNVNLEDVIPSSEEIESRIDTIKTTGKRRPILVVATDGAMMPTRPKAERNEKRGKGEYKEAKGFRIYLLGKDDMVDIASWHQIQEAEECAEALKFVASRVPADKVRIGLLGDGASWLWTAMKEAFPTGREILDYFHCSERIHAIAKAQYGEDAFKMMQWVESTMSRLFYGEVGYVIGGLRRMKPKNNDVKEQIRQQIVYLKNNKHRIHYNGDRKGSYPIGSGGIESANKFICSTRLKRSGAWWVRVNGNGMLKLRCSIVNGTFQNAFARYVTQDQAKKLLRTNA
jgi:hypothetical protein